MNLALIAAGLALLGVPGWTARLGQRLLPRDWARMTVVSLRAGLLAVRLGLLTTAAPTVLRAAGVRGLGEACHHLLGPVVPGGRFAAWVSAVVLALLQSRMLWARHRSRRKLDAMRVEPWLGHHDRMDDHDDHELVVLPSATPLAYAVDGRPPQVVVTDGLTRTLSDIELSAVLHHERCHLRHRHHRDLELAVVAEAAIPWAPTRRSAATLRLAVERWADEAAAERSGRAALRRALEKVVATMLDPVPAFTTAETIGARLAALDSAPRPAPRRWMLAATAPAHVLTALVAAAVVTGSLPVHHGALSLLGYCPL